MWTWVDAIDSLDHKIMMLKKVVEDHLAEIAHSVAVSADRTGSVVMWCGVACFFLGLILVVEFVR